MEQKREWFTEKIEEISAGLERLLKAIEELPKEDDDKERDYGI